MRAASLFVIFGSYPPLKSPPPKAILGSAWHRDAHSPDVKLAMWLCYVTLLCSVEDHHHKFDFLFLTFFLFYSYTLTILYVNLTHMYIDLLDFKPQNKLTWWLCASNSMSRIKAVPSCRSCFVKQTCHHPNFSHSLLHAVYLFKG